MNTLLALISTAVDSRVPTKLSLDALGLCCLFVSSAKPGSGHLGLLARHNYSALTSEPVQSCFSRLLLQQHTPSVPPLLLSHPFAHGTLPLR
jgi:hypothetical protein